MTAICLTACLISLVPFRSIFSPRVHPELSTLHSSLSLTVSTFRCRGRSRGSCRTAGTASSTADAAGRKGRSAAAASGWTGCARSPGKSDPSVAGSRPSAPPVPAGTAVYSCSTGHISGSPPPSRPASGSCSSPGPGSPASPAARRYALPGTRHGTSPSTGPAGRDPFRRRECR